MIKQAYELGFLTCVENLLTKKAVALPASLTGSVLGAGAGALVAPEGHGLEGALLGGTTGLGIGAAKKKVIDRLALNKLFQDFHLDKRPAVKKEVLDLLKSKKTTVDKLLKANLDYTQKPTPESFKIQLLKAAPLATLGSAGVTRSLLSSNE